MAAHVHDVARPDPTDLALGRTGISRHVLVPDHWLVSYDDYENIWSRQYVDQPLIGGHVLYLLGLTVLCVGVALRGRGRGSATQPILLARRLRWIGWACVAGGILIQLWSTGFALTPGGTGEGQIP
jgi:hypothetical protein